MVAAATSVISFTGSFQFHCSDLSATTSCEYAMPLALDAQPLRGTEPKSFVFADGRA
jgi:hypothetical protein